MGTTGAKGWRRQKISDGLRLEQDTGTTGIKGWRRRKISDGLRLVQDTTKVESSPTSMGKFNFYFT